MKNNNSKRIIAALAAAGLLSSGAVFAEYDPNKVIDPTLPYTTTSAPADGEQLPVAPAPEDENITPAAPNGATLYSVEAKELDGQTIIPLRSVAEGLGYTVEWHDDSQSISLTRGAQYISMAIGADSYSFSRMAPVSLGMAPTLVDGSTTYVPIKLITDIIGGTYAKNDDGTYKIVLPSIVDVKEVNENKTLLVNDSYLGEVILRITDETVITADGKAASADDIKEGTVLAVEYAQAMATSLPPQVNAVTIDIQNLPTDSGDGDGEDLSQQSVKFSGEIKSVSEGHVLIENDSDINPEIVLLVSDETVITKGNDKRVYKLEDLKEGMEIEGTHSMVMTFSLPPQTPALTINIKDADAEDDQDLEEAVEFSGTIQEVSEEGQVLIKNDGEGYEEIILIVTEDTKITKGDDKRVYKIDDLKKGMEIEGTHSQVMTRSLPPQTVAFEIEIQD